MAQERRPFVFFACLACFFALPALHAGTVTIALQDIDSGTTSPSGNYRWMDVANQVYSPAYLGGSYDYTLASLEVTYDNSTAVLQGTLVAANLKPNFAYQLKLVGPSGTQVNETIGFAGRWWQEQWYGTYWGGGTNLNTKGSGYSPSPNDLTYLSRYDIPDETSPTLLHYKYTGYLVLGYFITDELGDATVPFQCNNSYHVLWKTTQLTRDPAKDGPLVTSTFDADPAQHYQYEDGTDYPQQTVSLFGEWERLPVDGVPLQIGEHRCQMVLTEESFHMCSVTYGGCWAAAMGGDLNPADAGADSFGYESRAGAPYVCHLDGTNSYNAGSYWWQQTAGAAVTLRNASTATPDFDAPGWDGSTELTPEQATLRFRLTINQATRYEDSDECEIYIRIPGDGNGDDVVNAFDLAKLRQLDPEVDFNADGLVNAFDLAILRQNAGRRR